MTMRCVFSGLLMWTEIISYIYVSPFKKKSFQKVLRQLRKTILQNKPQHSSQTQGNTKGEYETLQVKGIKVMREKE